MRDYRQRALKKFLMRIGAHPRLHTAQLLQDFLEMDEVEWERKMQAPVLSNERSFTSSLGDTFNHALTRQWNTNVPVETAGSNYAQVISNGPTDPQIWEGTRQYLRQLDESIKGLRERVQCLIESRKNMSNSLHEFGVAFEKVGKLKRATTTLL
ncbi:hypothetical protein ERJ75_000774400 [Trypanosoma vivax]|nr:hypothetical protein ERJ75_000774400 [Trypanosoma vivax]